MVSLYNFVMPHKRLQQCRTPRRPAMALGLTDHVWSYRESIWLPVHTDLSLPQQLDELIALLLIPTLQDPPSGGKRGKSPPGRAGRCMRKSRTQCRRRLERLVIVLQDYQGLSGVGSAALPSGCPP
jgi:hypothetical protein